ncbi:MAG: heparinase II/III-family protein [Puniceicoccales bacterium]|jgi:hypothetical protein|nr:heparinase II/III-family protein [Puniceicoccales bacterium]
MLTHHAAVKIASSIALAVALIATGGGCAKQPEQPETPVSKEKNNVPGLLTQAFPDANAVRAVLVPRKEWKPFPSLTDRAAWDKADISILKLCADEAEKELAYEWQSPPATTALLISRTGNRSQYQAISYKKRTVLANMILAEIAENKGRYIDPIINGIWSICEESWWGSTAHLPRQYKGLMDVTRPRVDLYAGVTACILAWADYFLGEKFDEVSPQIRKRIRHEVNYRVLEPVLQHPHWWMQPGTGNWNPWISSNWLTAALLLEDNEERRATHVARILQVLDNFLTPYPNDGGCEEGPGYWGAATGAFYDNIALLNLATNDAFRFILKNEKIKDMGRYAYRIHIGERYSVNFADAPASAYPEAYITYRYAKDINDEMMKRFAASCWRGLYPNYVRAHYTRDFFNLFIMEELNATPPFRPFPREVWFPVIQVALAREKGGSTNGFFFAAKGGHNNGGHSHNDIGNTIVYYDGNPVLLDVGSGRYTARTFSEKRYDLWFNRSDYHNTPTINGVTQRNGDNFSAADAAFHSDDSTAVFSLNIAPAYPPEAGVTRWTRTVKLHRNTPAFITITDAAELTQTKDITFHFMTCLPARIEAPGKIILTGKNAAGSDIEFALEYDPARSSAEIEKVLLTTEEDTGVSANWGDNLRRINLRVKSPRTNDKFKWRISRVLPRRAQRE